MLAVIRALSTTGLTKEHLADMADAVGADEGTDITSLKLRDAQDYK